MSWRPTLLTLVIGGVCCAALVVAADFTRSQTIASLAGIVLWVLVGLRFFRR